MAKVIAALLRHGDYHQLPDTPSALQPFPLNAEGAEQAERSVTLIQGVLGMFNWALHPVIDSSQLLRGWQTAEVIRKGLQISTSTSLKIESFDTLAERSVGSAGNLTVQQIESVLQQDPRFSPPPPGWKSDSHYRLPLQGAESLMDAGERVARHLDNRLAELEQQVEVDTVKLFVGHGAAFRHAAHHLGVLEFHQIAALSMYHCRPVFLERRYAGAWRHLTGEWKVRSKGEAFVD
ncbi:MAG: histidine phosphatase family protein [Candidatus Thiodiazotropha sp. (ex Troendleina suluensis)]|nr:histidine phosphatase family protein [Candidatus Thiodiazotropha sp. (ex Troendleina suluensis)]MCU7945975.1 histidine phosphatase family protein [Candidatus Thiodiazotropha sp. (ex Cardiolucina cf. quadrata)]